MISLPRGRWREVLLMASLCLNVALATYVGVQWLAPPPPPGVGAGFGTGPGLLPRRLIARAADRLPKADADLLWRAYHAKERDVVAAQTDFLLALGRAARAIAAPDPDAAALREAMIDARDKRRRVGELVVDTFLEALPQMSAQGRRDLVSLPARR
jgi:uncharacterized membrane protein